MNYSNVWDNSCSIVKFNNSIDITDIEKANKESHGDERMFACTASIWDFSKCIEIDFSIEQLEYTTAVDLGSVQAIPEMKLALVLHPKENPAIHQVFEQYIKNLQSYGSPWQIQIFNSLDDAKKWTA